MFRTVIQLAVLLFIGSSHVFGAGTGLLPIPDRLVVLTFDDGTRTDLTTVALILKRYGFGASFYVTGVWSGQDGFMSWADIRELGEQGFEIGNHTESHPDLTALSKEQVQQEIEGVERKAQAQDIPAFHTFAYPGWHYDIQSARTLLEKGYQFARRGVTPEYPDDGYGARGPAYDPAKHHPLLIPTTGIVGPQWQFEDLVWAVDQAKNGKIAVLAYHGVPYPDAPWVSISPSEFERDMQYLHDQKCTVIAMRDLAQYVTPAPATSIPVRQAAGIFPQSTSLVQVTALKSEHLTEPLGLDSAHPRFRWLVQSSERGQLQSAYQVLVSSSLEKLRSENGDLWDSGKVTSENSVEVAYAGRELSSGERAFWKVRVWDRTGKASSYSQPSFFEMGLLSASDWQGKWIAGKPGISSPLLRRVFSIDAPIRRARVYVSGLGYYELSINGKKVGDRVLDPASTYYHNDLPFKLRSRVLYSTYDVTTALQRGSNVLGIMLGNGWYSPEIDPDGYRVAYGDRPRFILQMNIELADGRTVNVVSDPSWKTSGGPITYNDFLNGETYDARLEQRGWNTSGFNDNAWDSAAPVEPPSGVRKSQLLPAARVTESLRVVKEITPRDVAFEGATIYDLGQHFTGWARITVTGHRGAQLVLRYGSRVNPQDDTLDTRSNLDSGVRHLARQTDTYILKGEGTEVWEPRFTLHGFRYVEVAGVGDGTSLEKIEGRFVRSAVESTGLFVSSNDLLNRIHHNIQWTFMSSLQGIPQDAVDRGERIGWLGDTGFVGEDYIQNYDMLGFWEKWLNDIEDSQKEDGDIPYWSPLHWRHGTDWYGHWPSWQSTYPLLLWDLYQYYGDTRVLEEHYTSAKKLVDFLGIGAHDHLATEDLGDHMEPQESGISHIESLHTSSGLTATAYYYHDVMLLVEMAEVLGRPVDAKNYQRLAKKIKEAFNRKYFHSTTSQYGSGSQTSNALPLHLDLVPRENIPAVMKNLVDDIVNKHNTHVSTGIIGSNALVQALPQHGATSLMYRLANQTTYPSLGEQVTRGATTLCESYECSPWLSQNMKMFGSLDKFFYRNLAGIRPTSPGYRRVLIQPQPVGDLKTVTASQRTVRGTVAVDWIKGTTSFDLNVTIPAGMEADIDIPEFGLKNVQIAEGGKSVWKSNAYVAGTPGLTSAKVESDSIVFHAGSGSYRFTLNGAAE